MSDRKKEGPPCLVPIRIPILVRSGITVPPHHIPRSAPTGTATRASGHSLARASDRRTGRVGRRSVVARRTTLRIGVRIGVTRILPLPVRGIGSMNVCPLVSTVGQSGGRQQRLVGVGLV